MNDPMQRSGITRRGLLQRGLLGATGLTVAGRWSRMARGAAPAAKAKSVIQI